MAEYGLSKGLAVTLPWDQMIQQEQRNSVMRQQKQILAEQKAKMFADDTSYTNAMNGFDNPIIKNKMIERTALLGKFMLENQGWESNPQLRSVYNQIKMGYKDDPDLNRGLQSDANILMATKWLADPKNADIVAVEGENIKNQINNYVRFGNQRGEEGVKSNGVQPFIFTAPEDLFDRTTRAKEILGGTGLHGKSEQYTKGFIGGKKYFVTEDDKLKSAGALLGDQVGGKFYQQDWNKLTPEVQKGYGNDPRKYIVDTYNIFFPGDEYDTGQQPIDRTKGDGKGSVGVRDLFRENLNESDSKEGIPVQTNSDGISMLFGDINGNYNFNGAVMRNGSGNMIPINIGLVNQERVVLSDSKMISIPDAKNPNNKKRYASATIQMPVDEYNEKVWGGENAVDDGSVWYKPRSMETASIDTGIVNKRYKSTDFKLVRNEAGNWMVEFEFWKEVDDNSSNAASYNLGAGGLKEKFTSEESGKIEIEGF